MNHPKKTELDVIGRKKTGLDGKGRPRFFCDVCLFVFAMQYR